MLKLGKSKVKTYTQAELEKACAEAFLDGLFAANRLHVTPATDDKGNFVQSKAGELLLGKFTYNGDFKPSYKYYPLQGVTPVKHS